MTGPSSQPLAPGVSVAPWGIRWQSSRAQGPGGQNVNKLNTRIELWVAVSAIQGLDEPTAQRLRRLAGSRLTLADELHLSSQAHRSQEGNKQEVWKNLGRLIITAQVVPRRRRKTRPSAGSRARRLDSKRRHGQIKSHRRAPGQQAD